ncbi:malto-oligosyltrehalose synthase [Aureimonas fodinaquatilis]|uniref:Malto-oligosyltrehalose synthase n=1 Tax=Aureimonas fodinaquatilis TaxID=2565783 RepID=A0A5B0DSG2_9HYPH|nr:malto-oligosyltrehalose synthase [Aureimonas fodinaquatilis]KAA0968942.1 malto-oligosyltrehalose synthase [Aureimonas fodinaquatilis]
MTRALSATYRLQFREGFGFDEAVAIVPYLKALGVSHVYASPLFAATPGSTHGYDVVDYNRFDPELGGDDGFLRFSDALIEAGLGLILDFVPNHMGVSAANAWWEDVLRWGADSRHAEAFDISANAQKILIPVLAQPYGDALEAGDLSIVLDDERQDIRFSASDYTLPLDPRTLPDIFGLMQHADKDQMVRLYAGATPADVADLAEQLADFMRDPQFVDALHQAIAALNADKAALHNLHEAQNWRLAWWRLAREKLSYRRFFEIADLIGVRQEIRRVFRDSHRLVFSLARSGRLDGLRIDHVDGVADPKAYLAELRQGLVAAGAPKATLHVEKILTGPERLRKDWQVEGTTGYEFITALAGLYVDGSKEAAMSAAYDDFTGGPEDLHALIDKQKRYIFSHNLAGEMAVLGDEALAVAQRGLSTRDFGADTLSRAILEMATALPVYRTYSGIAGVPDEDRRLIDAAVTQVQAARKIEADEPVAFIGRLLKLDFEDGKDVAGALNFTRRFQQTTGAIMAKAVEDTVFYRWNRLLALNEVGGEPGHYGGGAQAFHEDMRIRLEDQPLGLMALSTHDTKRGEDARARLYALSEAPEKWAGIVEECARDLRGDNRSGHSFPDGAMEWAFYQSLLGVLPADFDPASREERAQILSRIGVFLEKAAREAKEFTSWTAPDAEYEQALQDFAGRALNDATFMGRFWQKAQPFVAAGALTSLSQSLIRMTAPGVPDIYQGTEFFDNSLVDPDNRRQVDYAHRMAAASDSVPDDWRSGAVKAWLLRRMMAARAATPELFTYGSYRPLEVTGENAENFVAFARHDNQGRFAITIAPRLTYDLLGGHEEPWLQKTCKTFVKLPEMMRRKKIYDALVTGGGLSEAGAEVPAFTGKIPMRLLLCDDAN